MNLEIVLNTGLDLIGSILNQAVSPYTNEVDGVDYYFISQEKFQQLIKKKAFLEYANVFKNLYGSTKEQVFKNLDEGHNVLFDIDWQGAQQIKNQTLNYKLISFFILPPSREILNQRLISRGESNEDVIKMRMQQFDKDVLHWVDYDFVVINEDLNECYREIVGFLEDKTKYDKSKIQNHIKKLI